MHRAKEQFSLAGFNVVFVGLGTPEQAEQFIEEFSLAFPIICDPHKRLYRMFDLGRSSVANLASPVVLFRGLRALSQGYSPGVPRGDVLQLPGVFLIDTEGNIRYAYFSKDASDHPSVDTLLGLEQMFR
ncbi:MAG: redoxin domain-containing protein [Nitrospiraceae bacterium]|nr:MAG: redoxin domain-containing protein [Nitrospiraceae bacterium]